MNQKEGTKLLVNFLREHDAYMAFRANMLKQRRMCGNKTYDFFAPLRINGGVIDRMLIWYNTKEGQEYWSRLDTKFRRLYVEMQKSASKVKTVQRI